jgi:hypothetical protein
MAVWPVRGDLLPLAASYVGAFSNRRRGQRLDVRLALSETRRSRTWSGKRVSNNWMRASHP